jgi:hypothetical protein
MAEARCRDEWLRASALMALIYNCNRDSKARTLRSDDFDPYAIRDRAARKGPEKKQGVGILKTVFIDRKFPEGMV